ncbi:GFA family protein [Aestuariicoccus sp. MJ-SS9]|uniref:GFA family protein n=1 Tax=Aestuariicoccus sp. MJ-SS9 TaxID=3079855 RepID=UPI0029152510|nr:GFA family protein [Aestuariicoccus sp. MJ-SS9]MDU8910751.1 GFA family protein [Aestuariicoccus sp. MJ-SS9]
MKIDGTCHCGAIVFEAELDPERVGICHCTDCQALSASAFRTIAMVRDEDFRLLKGTPQEYVKTGDSGNRRIQAFCGTCGSGIYATGVGDGPKLYNVRLGTVRQRRDLVPRFECWRKSALNWQPAVEGARLFDENPRF